MNENNPIELEIFPGIINNNEVMKNQALSQVLRNSNKNPLSAITKDITAKKVLPRTTINFRVSISCRRSWGEYTKTYGIIKEANTNLSPVQATLEGFVLAIAAAVNEAKQTGGVRFDKQPK